MSTTVETPQAVQSLADLLARLGDLPLHRIRIRPPLGTATVEDVVRIEQKENRLFELIAGVLVEKVMGYPESILAGFIVTALNIFVLPRKLGKVSGADGMMRLFPDLVRIPDVAFASRARLAGGKQRQQVPLLAPNLVVEVLSPNNTPREMEIKRGEYFEVGVELVWEIDPVQRLATVYRSLSDFDQLSEADRLEGGLVLPGFELPLAELFAQLELD